MKKSLVVKKKFSSVCLFPQKENTYTGYKKILRRHLRKKLALYITNPPTH